MRALITLGTLGFVVVALSFPASACGDKFLVNSKGVNIQGILSTTSPGAVVLYRNPDSPLATSVLDDQLVRDLTAAGHNVEVVTSFEDAQAMLTSGRHDLLVCDVDDAERLAQAVPQAGTLLLPVVDKQSKDEVKTAKNEFGRVLKAPGKPSYMVLQIDDTVKKVKKSSS